MIYALMVGEAVIEKSENETELIEKSKKIKNSYVCVWLGRLKMDDGKCLMEDVKEKEPTLFE